MPDLKAGVFEAHFELKKNRALQVVGVKCKRYVTKESLILKDHFKKKSTETRWKVSVGHPSSIAQPNSWLFFTSEFFSPFL